MKYAIYKSKVGLRYIEYIDSKVGIKYYPYIKEEYLPVVINSVGGFHSFEEEYEKQQGFLRIVEVNGQEIPLSLEEMFPVNSKEFEYGWIDPEGNSYSTEHEGHHKAASHICEKFNFIGYNPERLLEEKDNVLAALQYGE